MTRLILAVYFIILINLTTNDVKIRIIVEEDQKHQKQRTYYLISQIILLIG
jgi:hypothetical protein